MRVNAGKSNKKYSEEVRKFLLVKDLWKLLCSVSLREDQEMQGLQHTFTMILYDSCIYRKGCNIQKLKLEKFKFKIKFKILTSRWLCSGSTYPEQVMVPFPLDTFLSDKFLSIHGLQNCLSWCMFPCKYLVFFLVASVSFLLPLTQPTVFLLLLIGTLNNFFWGGWVVIYHGYIILKLKKVHFALTYKQLFASFLLYGQKLVFLQCSFTNWAQSMRWMSEKHWASLEPHKALGFLQKTTEDIREEKTRQTY